METKTITENTSMEDILIDIKTPKHKIEMFYETPQFNGLSDHEKLAKLTESILNNTKKRIRGMGFSPKSRRIFYDSKKLITMVLYKNGVVFSHGDLDGKMYNRVNLINEILGHTN